MTWTLGLLIYAVVQFIAFLFVLVATPIEMFKYKPPFPDSFPNRCITLWDYRLNCSDRNTSDLLEKRWRRCPTRRSRFLAAQAFALISIFVYGAAFVLGVIMLFCRCSFRWVCLVLNSVGAVTVCIVWASMVVTFYRVEVSLCYDLQAVYNYGAGFVLLLLAWLLDIANIPVLLFLCREGDYGESGKATEKKSQECEEETKEKERQD